MTQLLDRIRKDIDLRLRELRPAVEEAEQLEQALALLPDGAAARPRTRGRGCPRQTRPRKRRRITRAEAESRRARVLAILAQDPATKPSALALMLDTTPGNVYGLLRRLEGQGALKRQNGQYRVTAKAG